MSGESALRHVTVSAQPDTVVVAAGLARHQRAYVTDGLRRLAQCLFVDSFDELENRLPTMARCDAVILGPQDGRGRDAIGTVERLATRWPGTAIVIFCPARVETPPSMRSLFLAGAHQVVFEGVYDTAAALALAVENARRECAAETVLSRLQLLVPPPLHPLVHAVVSRPDTVTSVAEAAVALGVHRKTLVNRCIKYRFLQPAELIMWCRLALVGHFLERTGSTVESIGLMLGFASHTALRNLLKRYTGHRATELRALGGLTPVLAALESRIEAHNLRICP